MNRLWRLLLLYRPSFAWLALSIVVGLAALLANVALMGTSGWFIAAMGLAGAAGASLDYFTPAALIRVFAIARAAGRYAERLISHETTLRMIATLRSWLFRHIEPQSPTALEAYHSGDLSARLRADVDRLETVYLRLFGPFAVALLGGIAIVAWMDRYSGAFALVEAVLLVLAGLAFPGLLALRAVRWSREQVGLAVRLGETAVDALQGMAELQAFGAAGVQAKRFNAISDALIALQGRQSRLSGAAQAITLLCSNLALLAVVILAVSLVQAGTLQPPELVMVALVALAAFEAVAPLPAVFFAIGGVLESAGRIFALVDACPSPSCPAPAPPASADEPLERCDIQLSDVTFRYASDGPSTLDGFTLALPQGRRVALVGPAGTGKSTLILLLTGLLAPSGGQITVNGRPLADHDTEALRRGFAVAPQAPRLFTGTIRDNLRLARADAPQEQLWQALKIVALDGFVGALPDGLDSFIGEAGLTLSGGQARRLSVARALLKPAPVLILDEPGEGLDYLTERAMLDAILDDLGSRSLLLITHRRAGLEKMDEVVAMGTPRQGRC